MKAGGNDHQPCRAAAGTFRSFVRVGSSRRVGGESSLWGCSFSLQPGVVHYVEGRVVVVVSVRVVKGTIPECGVTCHFPWNWSVFAAGAVGVVVALAGMLIAVAGVMRAVRAAARLGA